MAQIQTPLDAPAHTRLFAEFANALDLADIHAKLWTPSFAIRHHTLGECLIDAMDSSSDPHTTLQHLLRTPVCLATAKSLLDALGGEDGLVVLRPMLMTLAADLLHVDPDVRLSATAAIRALSGAHADYHAAAGDAQDAADDEEFRSDYSDAARLAQKDFISEMTP